MLFWSFFRSLANQSGIAPEDQAQGAGSARPGGGSNPVRVSIEMKNGIKVEGNLDQVDE